jgi:hypothetical protein
LVVLGLLPAMMSPMLFDAPGSQQALLPNLIFYGIWGFEVVGLIAGVFLIVKGLI